MWFSHFFARICDYAYRRLKIASGSRLSIFVETDHNTIFCLLHLIHFSIPAVSVVLGIGSKQVAFKRYVYLSKPLSVSFCKFLVLINVLFGVISGFSKQSSNV